MGHLVELGDMWGSDYEPEDVSRLLPLLESICGEIAERVHAIEELENQRGFLEGLSPTNAPRTSILETQVTRHRAELERVYGELRALDCKVVGTNPLTIRITENDGARRRSFVWRSGDPALSG